MVRIIVAWTAALVSALALGAPAQEGGGVDLKLSLEADGRFSTLLRLAESADLLESLRRRPAGTLLAPTDAAFARLPSEVLKGLERPANRDWLREILLSHVAEKEVLLDEAPEGFRIESIAGPRWVVSRSAEGVRVEGARVLRADVRTASVRWNVFEGVLLPPDFVPEALTRADGTRRLVDLGARDREAFWFAVNDGVMGGRSSGGPDFEGRRLIFRGTLVTRGGGFSSIRTRTRDWRLTTAEGFRLRVKGDGRTYQFALRQVEPEGSRWERLRPSYRAEIRGLEPGVWTTVEIPFDAFEASWRGRSLEGPEGPRLVPGRIAELGFHIADGRDGPFRLEVESIESYRGADALPERMEPLRKDR